MKSNYLNIINNFISTNLQLTSKFNYLIIKEKKKNEKYLTSNIATWKKYSPDGAC